LQNGFPALTPSSIGDDSIVISVIEGTKRGGRGRRRCLSWSINGPEDQTRFGVVRREVPQLMKSSREHLDVREPECQLA